MKKERNMKVYGYESKYYDYPAEIRLKGKWLKELGFTVNTPITVVCEEGKLTITRKDSDIR
ncbi:MAG: SymE family type I addiction module toxin [Anaerovoracaceae bacterium]|jgi:toxic protein SymE